MVFQEGNAVEVMCNEDGFFGSYWEGTVLTKLESSTNMYVVEYKNLLEEDCPLPLREVVSGHAIRPVLPEILVARYEHGDRVDSFDRDGWWVGTVLGSGADCSSYYVYFEAFNVGIVYDISKIRVHKDWTKGKWSDE